MLLEAKSNLARLMATENLTVEERNVQTASFDIKSRILTVPILNGALSSYLYDLLLGHEVGHALETPAQGWHDSLYDHKVNKDILNVCEDVRIEKKIKRKFPGLKLSFVRGYQELMEMDFFGVKGKDLNAMNFIDRINLHTKGGASHNIVFSDAEKVLLEEVESTETWDEVVIVAKKIQEFMKAEMKRQPEEQKEEEAVPDDSEGDDSEEQDSEDETGSKTSAESAPGSKEKDDKKKQEGKRNESDKSKPGSSGTMGSEEQSIESKTDKSFREREKDLYSKDRKKDCIYSEIPKLNLDKVIIPFREVESAFLSHNKKKEFADFYNPAKLKSNFLKFKNETNKIVSYLVKEFELRKNADQQSRARVAKTGELNMDKIHSYQLTDDIFKRITNVPNGKSHGLVMFIDWSGSMQDHIHSTVKQLLNLVMFCKKVNIPFEVYAFTSQWYKDSTIKIQKPKIGDLHVYNFSLLNLLSSRMSAKEYVTMASFLLDYGTGYRKLTTNCSIPAQLSLGGTPLNHAIVAAFDIIPEFKKANKLQIVNSAFLTDGESSFLSERYGYVDYSSNMRKQIACRPTNIVRPFLRDPKTKVSVEIKPVRGYGGDTAQQTKALLQLLKQRAECNLVGFFIADSRSIRSAMEIYGDYTDKDYHKIRQDVDTKMNEFKKEKVFIIENFGYDEYYLIRSTAMETEEEEMKINTNSTRGLVSAFSKYTEGKISSRIILNRFIRMIA
jgi:hypothetical protein